MPAPRTATLVTLGRDVLGAARAGVDRLEVEEERLDHVLRRLSCGQLHEVAGLDDLGGVEVDLGALDGGGHDVARGRVGGAAGLLAQVGREGGQVGGELGVRRGAAGDAVAGAVPGLRGLGVGVDEGAGLGEHLLAGLGDLVDQAVLQGAARAVLGALEEHLQQRVGDAEQADGADDAAASGQQAQGDLRAADLGAGGVQGDAVVAGQGDLVTAAQGRAVDGGDDRLAQGLHAAQLALEGQAAVEQLLGGVGGDPDQVAQVAAGEEGLLGGGEDDAAEGVLLRLQAVGDRGEGVAERLVDGVRGLVGVVEDEGDDAGVVLLPADGGGLGAHEGVLQVIRREGVRCVRRWWRCPCRRPRRAWRARSACPGAPVRRRGCRGSSRRSRRAGGRARWRRR